VDAGDGVPGPGFAGPVARTPLVQQIGYGPGEEAFFDIEAGDHKIVIRIVVRSAHHMLTCGFVTAN
jgi:hypothetical protein